MPAAGPRRCAGPSGPRVLLFRFRLIAFREPETRTIENLWPGGQIFTGRNTVSGLINRKPHHSVLPVEDSASLARKPSSALR
ncbi:hypothetical protein GA0004734_00012430 [Rhizobium sp. 9140]|nr:hypothetical protein GA0004734_00012430 [Rhizobium sp. 9140]